MTGINEESNRVGSGGKHLIFRSGREGHGLKILTVREVFTVECDWIDPAPDWGETDAAGYPQDTG